MYSNAEESMEYTESNTGDLRRRTAPLFPEARKNFGRTAHRAEPTVWTRTL